MRLTVMNQVLGGGPQARLFLDLREEHSLTYGSYSRFNAEIYPGDWAGVCAGAHAGDGRCVRPVPV